MHRPPRRKQRKRGGRWDLVPNSGGTYDVLHNGRPKFVDLPLATAHEKIRQLRTPNDRAWAIEDDGYRMEITSQL